MKAEEPYRYHPERFDNYVQLLCRNGLTGRCYWEIVMKGTVYTGVTYRGISRRGSGNGCKFGGDEKSWCLYYYLGYFIQHGNIGRRTRNPNIDCNKLAVYLDWPAGTLSFYSVSSDGLTHIDTVHSRFTEPIYPGFGFEFRFTPGLCVSSHPSWVLLRQMHEGIHQTSDKE